MHKKISNTTISYMIDSDKYYKDKKVNYHKNSLLCSKNIKSFKNEFKSISSLVNPLKSTCKKYNLYQNNKFDKSSNNEKNYENNLCNNQLIVKPKSREYEVSTNNQNNNKNLNSNNEKTLIISKNENNLSDINNHDEYQFNYELKLQQNMLNSKLSHNNSFKKNTNTLKCQEFSSKKDNLDNKTLNYNNSDNITNIDYNKNIQENNRNKQLDYDLLENNICSKNTDIVTARTAKTNNNCNNEYDIVNSNSQDIKSNNNPNKTSINNSYRVSNLVSNINSPYAYSNSDNKSISNQVYSASKFTEQKRKSSLYSRLSNMKRRFTDIDKEDLYSDNNKIEFTETLVDLVENGKNKFSKDIIEKKEEYKRLLNNTFDINNKINYYKQELELFDKEKTKLGTEAGKTSIINENLRSKGVLISKELESYIQNINDIKENIDLRKEEFDMYKEEVEKEKIYIDNIKKERKRLLPEIEKIKNAIKNIKRAIIIKTREINKHKLNIKLNTTKLKGVNSVMAKARDSFVC